MTKQKISINGLLQKLGQLKNSRFGPAKQSDDEEYPTYPPVVFWWFEDPTEEIDLLIAKAVKNFQWQSPWIITKHDNKKLLYPKRIQYAEKQAQNSKDPDPIISTKGKIWLMNHEPELCKQANKDLESFTEYFSKIVEKYLEEKAQ